MGTGADLSSQDKEKLNQWWVTSSLQIQPTKPLSLAHQAILGGPHPAITHETSNVGSAHLIFPLQQWLSFGTVQIWCWTQAVLTMGVLTRSDLQVHP